MVLNMKSTIATIAILALIGLGVSMAASAANTANVSATVTAELITIVVADGVVDYGILPISTIKNTTTGTNGGADGTQTVTNNSNVIVNLDVKSSDAVGGTQWNLAGSIGADAFTHKFCVTTCNSSPTWIAFNANNTTYVSLATNIAASSGTQDFDLEIGTPSSVSDNTLKTITVTVLATAI